MLLLNGFYVNNFLILFRDHILYFAMDSHLLSSFQNYNRADGAGLIRPGDLLQLLSSQATNQIKALLSV